MTLQIEPGTLIDEGSLTLQLGIGRTPLREAVQRLSHEGLIVHIPRRGSWASSFSLIDLRHMVEARRVVEPAAARLAAQCIDPQQAERLRSAIDRAESLVPLSNFADCVFIDQEFHSLIAQSARNPSLSRMIEGVNQELMRYWYFSFTHVRNVELPFQQHREIFETIVEGDAANAERLMHAHIDLFLARVQEALSSGPRANGQLTEEIRRGVRIYR